MPHPVSDTEIHTYLAVLSACLATLYFSVLNSKTPFLSIASVAFKVRFINTCVSCPMSVSISGIPS